MRFLRSFARPLTGLAAVLALVGVIGAIALTGAGVADRSPSIIPTNPLKQMTVSEAIEAVKSQALSANDLFEVQGWLRRPVPRELTCPGTMSSLQFDSGCGNNKLEIGGTADGGPELQAAALEGTTVPDALQASTSAPIVVVGHVHDLRSSLCPESSRADCNSTFVLDQVVSFDGKSFGPSVGLFAGEYPAKPRMSVQEVIADISKVLQPGSSIVSMTALSLDAAQTYSPGFAPNGEGSLVLWYARVAGPPPTVFPMPGSQAGTV